MKRRISAALLTLCLLMSLMPTVAFAAPSGSFDDVDGHWGQAAVERWAGYGVVNGDGTGNFNPDNQMTRAEFATMLANMLGYKEKATNTFSDVNDSDWFADAILKLAAAGVIQGSNGMANPNAPISRQEAAVMMCRAFNIPTTGGSLDFADSADVADWAKGAVAALASRGMMNGVGGNNVAPLANINRASVATLLDNMITEYVTEDKTVSGEVKGIVLVAGNATVTFEDATLAENLIVAPKAEGAEVVLTGSTTAGDVYVDGTATVKVDSSATAGDVQVGAANSTVEVAGKADTVTVDSAAADTKVNVGKDATVGTVDVAGANTAVTVDGKVDNVNVSSSATGTDVVANSGATVGKVETAAKDVTVSGNGKVENVTATDGTVAVTTPNTNVTNKTDSADNVTNQGKPVPPENGGGTPTPTPPSGGSNGGGTTTEKADLVVAPLVDQAGSNAIPSADLGKVTVDSKKTAENTYDVTVAGTNIMNHNNANQVTGHWVGFGMPAAPEGKTYSYTVNGVEVQSIAERTYEVDGKTYNTVYFSFNTPAEYVPQTIVVKEDSNVVATYNVKFNVTFKSDFGVKVLATKDETADIITKLESAEGTPPWAHKFAEGLGFTGTTVDGNTIKLSGETTIGKLESTSTGSAGADGYLTYVLNVTDDTIKDLKVGAASDNAELDNLDLTGISLVMNKKIYDGAGANFINNASTTYKLLDANSREQGQVTVTVDTAECTVEGKKTVVFNSNGGTAVNSKVVDTNAKLTLPVSTKTGYTLEGWYKEAEFTNKWSSENDTVTSNITLYAKWTADEYTLTYNLNSVEGTAPEGGTVTVESTGLKAAAAVTADGKTFLGWAFDSSAENADYTAGAAMTASDLIAKARDKTITLYAIWKENAPEAKASTATAATMTADDYNKVMPGFFGESAKFPEYAAVASVTKVEDNKFVVAPNNNTALPYVTGFEAFNNSVTDEQSGYYVLVTFQVTKPEVANGTTIADNTVIVTLNGGKTMTYKQLNSGDNNTWDGRVAVMIHIPSSKIQEGKYTGDAMTYKIDLDGDSGKEYTATEYTLDFSGMTFKGTSDNPVNLKDTSTTK